MRKLLTLLFVLAFLNCVASAQVYEATYLRSGSGRITGASGINDSGMIVGWCYLDFTTYHACYWTSSGVATDLGTLGGKLSGATAVNSLGQIAGDSDASDGGRAFIWTKAGGMQALPSLGSNPADFASAINDSGAVVGTSRLTPSGPYHAFLWTSSGGIQDLGTLPGEADSSIASGINSAGHVVGNSENFSDGSRKAFMWTSTTGMQELSPASGLQYYAASAINDSDEVVGSFTNPADNKEHGFLWTKATGIKDLGVLPNGSSAATAIDKAGTSIVGRGRGSSPSSRYGLIWRSGTILKLDTSAGIHLGFGATGINSSGQIIANQSGNGVLLNPSWVKLSTRSFNFNSVTVGQTSPAKNLTITNIGSTTLTMKSISITGTNPGDFAQTNNCPATLAPAAHCVVHVTFTPTAIGYRHAAISLSDSDPTSPQQIALAGGGM